jgi:hypothetical protein
MIVFVNIPFENEFTFWFCCWRFGSEGVSMSIFYIYRRNDSGWVAYMLGCPVPTTKLHEYAEGERELSR